MLTDLAVRLLRALPAETAHRATIRLAAAAGPLLAPARPDDPRLRVEAFGLQFSNPVGLAAGFDKDAEVPAAMLKFGFGFVECGTVTPRPQEGNPKPRLFRLVEDEAVINRMGFNNRGMEEARRRLAGRPRNGIVGINIGANKDTADRVSDYRRGFAALAPLASYVTVNVSSPNTPGLRGLQDRDALRALLDALREERARLGRHVPVLLKIAPDLDETALDDIADVGRDSGLDGLIVSNTTVARPVSLKSPNAKEAGGLSGRPLFEPSTRILKAIRKRVGSSLVLVGVGGIGSGEGAYEKIRAGAALVQLYTALAYRGPGLVARIKRDLVRCLERDGISRLSDAIGADAA